MTQEIKKMLIYEVMHTYLKAAEIEICIQKVNLFKKYLKLFSE